MLKKNIINRMKTEFTLNNIPKQADNTPSLTPLSDPT